MKVNCPACSAKYTIADEKVLGRRVKVRCKTCGQPITVDGTQLEDPSAGLDSGEEEDEATRIASVPSFAAVPEPEASGDVWSVNVTETDQRSMTTAALADAYASGEIGDDAFVWREGMGDWLPIGQVPEFAAAAPVAAPPRAPVGRGPAARVSPGRSAGQDLFGAPAPAAPAPAAASRPGASAYDDKPVGARNENSVLFSLDALKAGIPSKSETGAVKRPERSAPAAGLDDLMNLGGGGASPLFSLASNQALLTAPAPPEPPPPPPPSLAPASAAAVPATAAPAGKLPWLGIAAGGGVVAVIAVVLVLVLGGKKDEPAAQVAKSEPTATEPAKANAEPPKPEEPKAEPAKPDEPKPEEAKPEASAAAPAGTEAVAGEKKEPTEEEKKRFADAKKEEEEKKKAEAEKKAETPAPTGGGAPFNKGAAVAALSSAASASSACKRPGGPTGTGRATVTFAPSGRATNATVSGGAFGGTSVGGCIASVFRRAKVPPFDGDPVTVGKSFTISD